MAIYTGTSFIAPAETNTHKRRPRWQTAGMHPECYSPRRKNRSMQATDVFYKVLGILWLMTITVMYVATVINFK